MTDIWYGLAPWVLVSVGLVIAWAGAVHMLWPAQPTDDGPAEPEPEPPPAPALDMDLDALPPAAGYQIDIVPENGRWRWLVKAPNGLVFAHDDSFGVPEAAMANASASVTRWAADADRLRILPA